jgi:hypothetical protein
MAGERTTNMIDDKSVVSDSLPEGEAGQGARLDRRRLLQAVGASSFAGLALGAGAVPEGAGAQAPPTLRTGSWNINGNGYEDVLRIDGVSAQGKVSGTAYGQPIDGYWDEDARKLTFIRIIDPTNPSKQQIFTGFWFQNPVNPGAGQNVTHTLAGFFEAFSGTGGSAQRTLYGWFARIEFPT